MNLIDVIPIGKKNKKTRQELMYEAKIMNIRTFRQEMASLKKQYIIIFDDGYYLPATKKEYIDFIKKMNAHIGDAINMMELAYNEMEGLEEV